MGLIQIDSVNVLVRSQELPFFARLGAHPRTFIHDATRAGELFEYWAHEAAHVDMRHYHLHRWKMTREHDWEITRRRPGYVDEVYQRIADSGPIAAGDISERVGKKGSWWDWDDAKLALEYLFMTGRLGATRRPADFARVYDLTERVIPADALARPVPTEAEARRELLALAAGHMGVATLEDLADYHRQKPAACKPLVAELVEDGRLVPVEVESWTKPAYLAAGARIPRRVDACALLSPFDPVVWHRPRAERLFGFHYRIEIYTPAPKRQFGYYVLPILHGERIVGRLDMKAERGAGDLQVRGAFTEPDVDPSSVAPRVAAELAAMADWLALDRVTVAERGDLAPSLRAAVASLGSTR